MNYKERYEQALERAKECLKDDSIIAKAYVESIFPELTMSEDEKMKDYIKDVIQAAIIPKKENKQKMIAWLEKQGEQKPILDFKASDWYVSKVDGKIHNMYHSDDKIEPKFKVGDWITDGYIYYKITEILDDRYIIESKYDERSAILFEYENRYHLWSINDAKNGDVLVDEDNNIGIYSGEKDDLYGWNSCIYLVCNNKLYLRGCHKHKNTKPATKEQCDLLFEEMTQAGYEWDSEKKELKKIEPKTLNANKVVEWLDEHVPTKFEDMQNYVNQFKKDFEI